MKFVCMKCETFMLFQKLERPAEDSLGVMFECPQCGTRMAMVTNPGETQLVGALGVKIGGRTTAPEPFELTRGTLKETAAISSPPSVSKSGESGEAGSCPFSAMLSNMEEGTTVKAKWSDEALERMERIPEFVRPMIKGGIEAFAARKGYQVITPTVIDESKNDMGGMSLTAEAKERMENIPSFIRPMVKMEIERMARERGLEEISVDLLEEAKGKFGQFMSQ